MYLAVILVIVAAIVFYNEFNTKMHIAEMALLAIGLIAIIRAAYNYTQIDNSEGFASVHRRSRNNKKNNNNKNPFTEAFSNMLGKDGEDMEINSEDSDEYLDPDAKHESSTMDKFNTLTEAKKGIKVINGNKENDVAVKKVNELLGVGKSGFSNVTSGSSSSSSGNGNGSGEIQSIFVPQILIGQGDEQKAPKESTNWLSGFKQDGMSFNDTMQPTHNLWRDEHNYYNDGDDQWTRNLDDYNKGKWQPNLYKRPSDYIDYYAPGSFGTSTPSSNSSAGTTTDEYGREKKLCGAYDDVETDKGGNLVVKDYRYAKTFVPGYTYVPPSNWDVPQKHISKCMPPSPNVRQLTGLVDRGLPLNVLELNPDGSIANSEESVTMTNVGSLMPKFVYQEAPFSKPYV